MYCGLTHSTLTEDVLMSILLITKETRVTEGTVARIRRDLKVASYLILVSDSRILFSYLILLFYSCTLSLNDVRVSCFCFSKLCLVIVSYCI